MNRCLGSRINYRDVVVTDILFVSLFVLFVYVLVGEEREKNLIIKLVHSHFETTQFKRYGK